MGQETSGSPEGFACDAFASIASSILIASFSTWRGRRRRGKVAMDKILGLAPKSKATIKQVGEGCHRKRNSTVGREGCAYTICLVGLWICLIHQGTRKRFEAHLSLRVSSKRARRSVGSWSDVLPPLLYSWREPDSDEVDDDPA